MADKDSSAGTLIAAFAVGALAGAAVALLLAPASGAETRRRLARRAREGRDRLQALGREGREFLQRQTGQTAPPAADPRPGFDRARPESL